jgi:hypothetical protein
MANPATQKAALARGRADVAAAARCEDCFEGGASLVEVATTQASRRIQRGHVAESPTLQRPFQMPPGHAPMTDGTVGSGAPKPPNRLEANQFAEYDSPTPSGTGEVTEWPIVLVSKTSVPARVPRVRIPASPLLNEAAVASRWLFSFCVFVFMVIPRIVLELF